MSRDKEHQEYLKGHLSGLVGGTILQVEAADDGEGGYWPVLVIQDKNGNVIQIEASADEEGNGPGHIFIGVLKGEDFEDYHRMSGEKSWELLWSGISGQ